ncbi:MAG: diguanylate cyclase, partial [bacterium]
MKLSIRWKIVTMFILVVITAVSAGTYLNVESQLQARKEELESRAHAMGQVIALKFANQLLTGSSIDKSLAIQMDVWLSQISDAKFLAVYNSDGKLIFKNIQGNDKNIPSFDLSKRKNNFFNRVMKSDKKFFGRVIENSKIYDILIPIELFHTHFGLIRLGFDITRFQRDQLQILQLNALFGLVLIVIVTAIGIWLTSWVVRPIEDLEKATAELGEGNLDARAEIESGDEIQQLAERFNDMAGSLQNRIQDLQTLQALNRKISARLRAEDLHDHIVHLIHETWEINNIALLLKDDDDTMDVAAGLNVYKPHNRKADIGPLQELLNPDIPGYRHFTDSYSLDKCKPIFHETGSIEFTEALVYPLKSQENFLGYLLLAREEETFTEEEIELISTLTYQIKIAIENANHYTRAVTDGLTGLYTRRFFDLQLREDPDVQPVSLAMIDIDNFKEYNDTFGHPAGDKVLKKLADTFLKQVRTGDTVEATRKSDTVARYGGEEFGIILPNTDLDSACKVTQRIVDAVSEI